MYGFAALDIVSIDDFLALMPIRNSCADFAACFHYESRLVVFPRLLIHICVPLALLNVGCSGSNML